MNPGSRRHALAILVLALGLLLAACGSSDGDEDVAVEATSSTTAAATSTSPSPASTSSTTASPAPVGRGGMPGASTAPTPTHADLAYATTSTAQKLDLWLPEGAEPAPLVVNIHGGAFKALDKSMATDNVRQLLDAGYAVASINYRLSGEALFPAAPQDVKAAVRWLRANAGTYGLDPERFVAWGGSAGGNLAALLGVTGDQTTELDDASLGNADVSSAVQVVVDWFGPVDFLAMDSQFGTTSCTTPDSHDAADSPESAYLGAPIQTVPDLADAASPVTYVSGATTLPRFVIAHGDSDCQIPTGQSQEFAELLEQAGAEVTLTILPGAVHADPQFSEQIEPTIAILDETFGR